MSEELNVESFETPDLSKYFPSGDTSEADVVDDDVASTGEVEQEELDETEVDDADDAEEADEESEDYEDESEDDEEEDEPSESDAKPEWSFDRQKYDQLMATLEKATAKVESNPTEKNVAAAEKAKTNLDKLLESEEIDTYEAIPELAQALKDSRDEAKELRQRLAKLEERATLSAHQSQFVKQHPSLEGQYEAIAKKADQSVRDLLGDSIETASNDVLNKLWNSQFEKLAGEADAVKTETKQVKRKPKAKSAKGTKPIPKKSSGKAKEKPLGEVEAAKRFLSFGS